MTLETLVVGIVALLIGAALTFDAGSLVWSIVALALIVAGVLAQTRVSQMYVLDPEGSRLG